MAPDRYDMGLLFSDMIMLNMYNPRVDTKAVIRQEMDKEEEEDEDEVDKEEDEDEEEEKMDEDVVI